MESVALLLQNARSLQLTPQKIQSGGITYQIQFSIKCLEVALLQSPKPQQLVEILYELAKLYLYYTNQYQRVQDLVQKALVLVSSVQSDLLYPLWDLQIQLYLIDKLSLAKQFIKSCISNSQGYWNTRFTLRKLEMHELVNDWEGYHHSSNQFITQLKASQDHQQLLRILLQKSQFSFRLLKMDFVDQSLQEFQNVFQSLNEPVQYLHTIKTMIEILFLTHLGQLKAVPPLIVQLHSTILQPVQQDIINASFFAENNIPYLMAYLVSGIAHKASDNNRSKIFFKEGLKAIDLELKRNVTYQSPLDWFRIKRNLDLIRIYSTLHMVEVCLLRCEFGEAFQELMTITKLCCADPQLLKQFQHHLMLDWAMLLQCAGQDEKAILIYQKLKEVPLYSWIAKLHLYTLENEPELLQNLVDEMDPKSNKQQMAMSIIQGTKCSKANEFQKAKEYLLQGIKLSDAVQDTVLSASCLGLLGSLFFHTNRDQALKMLQTCISFSKKSNAVMLEMFALEQIQPESPEVAILEQKIKAEQINVMKLLDTVFGH